MRTKLILIARLLLGVIFFVFGLNGFLEFMAEPEMSEDAGAFITALQDSGYLFALLKVMEVLCGALLLAGLFVPLALVLLAPIIVNIALFHIFLEPVGLGFALDAVMLSLFGYLTATHWEYYKLLLSVKTEPISAKPGGTSPPESAEPR